MSAKQVWSRRNFVQMMGAAVISSRAVASTIAGKSSSDNNEVRFVYAGCVGSEAEGIEVFAFARNRLQRIQHVKSDAPVSMVVSSGSKRLYVANQVAQYDGLPRGTVEAYAVGSNGTLTLLNRQALSLSATMPRHLAIAPDGKSLLVTASGGGLYNMMPITEDGSVGRAMSIHKVTGDAAGRKAAPRMAMFDEADRVLIADEGTGHMSLLSVNDGTLAANKTEAIRSEGSPRQIVFHPNAKTIYVAHDNAIESYGYDHTAGRFLERQQRIAGTGIADGSAALAFHSTKDILLACDNECGVTAWKTAADGTLRYAGRHAVELGQLSAIAIAPAADGVMVLNSDRGEIASAALDAATGQLSETRLLAHVDSPSSLAIIYG